MATTRKSTVKPTEKPKKVASKKAAHPLQKSLDTLHQLAQEYKTLSQVQPTKTIKSVMEVQMELTQALISSTQDLTGIVYRITGQTVEVFKDSPVYTETDNVVSTIENVNDALKWQLNKMHSMLDILHSTL